MRNGIARVRHLLHSHYERLRKNSVLKNFLAERSDTLEADADAATFTVNTSTDEVTIAGHGLTTGAGPYVATSSGTLPAPLTATMLLYVTVVDANTVKFASSKKRAVAGTNIDITTAGSGTHTLTTATSEKAIHERLKFNKPETVAAATDIDDLA